MCAFETVVRGPNLDLEMPGAIRTEGAPVRGTGSPAAWTRQAGWHSGKNAAVTDGEFLEVVGAAFTALERVVHPDWSVPAGSLEWTCWETIEHTIDCVHSFALQIAAREESRFLPFAPMRAEASAMPSDLLTGLRAAAALLVAIARDSPQDLTTSDGVIRLSIADWRARAAFEVALHTYDVTSGLGVGFALSDELSDAIIASPALWMLDGGRLHDGTGGWSALIEASGR